MILKESNAVQKKLPKTGIKSNKYEIDIIIISYSFERNYENIFLI